MKYVAIDKGFQAARGRTMLRPRSSLWELQRVAATPAGRKVETPCWSQVGFGVLAMLVVLTILLCGAAWLGALR